MNTREPIVQHRDITTTATTAKQDYQSKEEALRTWDACDSEETSRSTTFGGISLKRPVCIVDHNDYPVEINTTRPSSTQYDLSVQKPSMSYLSGLTNESATNGKILTTAILLRDFTGRHYSRHHRCFSDIQVERGSLLRSIPMTDDGDIIRELKDSYRCCQFYKEPLFMKCLDVSDVYVRVPSSEILLLSDYEASILLAIRDSEARYEFHRDSSRFTFVEQLTADDSVMVEVMEFPEMDWPPISVFGNSGGCGRGRTKMAKGWVEWIGEPMPREGTKFGIRLESALGNMDGTYRGRRLFSAPHNGAVLVTGDMLRRPFAAHGSGSVSIPDHLCYSTTNTTTTTNTNHSTTSEPFSSASAAPAHSSHSISARKNRSTFYDEEYGAPLVRNVPIRMVPSSGHHVEPPPAYSTIFPENDNTLCDISLSNNHSTRNTPQTQSRSYPIRHETSSNAAATACVSKPGPSPPVERNIKNATSLMDSSSGALYDVNTMGKTPTGSMKTVSMPHCCALRNGDRIVWFDKIGAPKRGTVRWTGRLKGHSNIYVGVDFDEKIGGGTGRYDGLELFRAPMDHASLIPLWACMKETDMDAPLSTDEQPHNNRPQPSNINTTNTDNIKLIPPTRLQNFNDLNNHSTTTTTIADTTTSSNTTTTSSSSSSSAAAAQKYSDIEPLDMGAFEQSPFTVGSCVEVDYRNERRFGVVKWIDYMNDEDRRNNDKSVAVEIEGPKPREWPSASESGIPNLNGALWRANGPVAIVPTSSLRQDNRFATPIVVESVNMSADLCTSGTHFGSLDGGVEVNACQPTRNIECLIGRMKGIQGYRNSCYLDATLYAMFVQSTAFDSILESRDAIKDPCRQEVIRVLATEIVYPLRKFHFVRADHVFKLRQLLERVLSEISGLTSDEKDPEEVLNALFDKVLRVEPFLLLRNVTEGTVDSAYICPLITEDLWSGEQRLLITVQSIVERSLFASNIQFAKDPKVLILQLPRYGQQKVFGKIIPQQELDITHLVFESKRPCTICGKAADLICPECFLTKEVLLSDVTYCECCYKRAHTGFDHRSEPIKRRSHSKGFMSSTSSLTRRSQLIPQRKLQLSAVLCIEMSHYVTFVRTVNSNRWLMFDSMADRVGLSDGYNVPEVKQCSKVAQWLNDSGVAKLRASIERDHHLPPEVEADPQLSRLLSDCYVCIYTADEQSEKRLDPIQLAARFLP